LLYYGFIDGNIYRAIVVFAFGLTFLFFCYTTWVENNFHEKCESPLELASAASTIEIASSQLTAVIARCKEYKTGSTHDFWLRNLDQELKNLQQVNPTATAQEKDSTLSQFREVMKNSKEIIRNPSF